MRKSQITKKKVLAITPPGGATDGGQHVDDKKTCTFDCQASDTTTPSVKNTTQPVLLNFRNFAENNPCRLEFLRMEIGFAYDPLFVNGTSCDYYEFYIELNRCGTQGGKTQNLDSAANSRR